MSTGGMVHSQKPLKMPTGWPYRHDSYRKGNKRNVAKHKKISTTNKWVVRKRVFSVSTPNRNINFNYSSDKTVFILLLLLINRSTVPVFISLAHPFRAFHNRIMHVFQKPMKITTGRSHLNGPVSCHGSGPYNQVVSFPKNKKTTRPVPNKIPK